MGYKSYIKNLIATENDIRKVLEEAYKFPLNLTPQYKFIYEALKRNKPMKVEIGTSKYFKFPICPNCKTELNEYYKYANKFCKECGQKLDWSE